MEKNVNQYQCWGIGKGENEQDGIIVLFKSPMQSSEINGARNFIATSLYKRVQQ